MQVCGLWTRADTISTGGFRVKFVKSLLATEQSFVVMSCCVHVELVFQKLFVLFLCNAADKFLPRTADVGTDPGSHTVKQYIQFL